MSIQTQQSISHLLYVSSAPIVYRMGDLIFTIKIFNIFHEKGRGREASTRESAACGHNPHILGYYSKEKARGILVQPYQNRENIYIQ